jgi:sodium/potassium-transporting ATPase subunit alpha
MGLKKTTLYYRRPLGDPDPAVANLALAVVLLIVIGIQAFFNAWQGEFSPFPILQGQLLIHLNTQTTRRVASWRPSSACFPLTSSSLVKATHSSQSPTPHPNFVIVESRIRLPATELVFGDIVTITLGSKVPADLRLVEVSSDLRFDRSILTGESNAIPGTVECTDPNCTPLFPFPALPSDVLLFSISHGVA